MMSAAKTPVPTFSGQTKANDFDSSFGPLQHRRHGLPVFEETCLFIFLSGFVLSLFLRCFDENDGDW